MRVSVAQAHYALLDMAFLALQDKFRKEHGLSITQGEKPFEDATLLTKPIRCCVHGFLEADMLFLGNIRLVKSSAVITGTLSPRIRIGRDILGDYKQMPELYGTYSIVTRRWEPFVWR